MIEGESPAKAAQCPVCSDCQERQADVRCDCESSQTFLCMQDLPSHYEQFPDLSHSLSPVRIIPKHPGYYSRLQDRLKAFAKGKKELLTAIQLIDSCCEEYDTEMTELITALDRFKDESIEKLQAEKERMIKAIEEAAATLYLDAPTLADPLTYALRNSIGRVFEYQVLLKQFKYTIPTTLYYKLNYPSLTSSPSEQAGYSTAPSLRSIDKTQLVWTKGANQLYARLSFNVIREICDYIEEEPKPVAVFRDEVKCFDLNANKWLDLFPLSQDIEVDCFSSSEYIPTDRLFVCGGGSGSHARNNYVGSTAYIIDGSGTVRQLQNMYENRWAQGIVYYAEEHAVYIFGGQNSNNESTVHIELSSSEKYSLSSSRLKLLRTMKHGRSGFVPCIYNSVIYLCGGGVPTVETYNPLSNVFTEFSIDNVFSGVQECFAVIRSECLYVFSINTVFKWYLKRGKYSRQSVNLNRTRTNFTPVVRGDQVYIVHLKDKVCKIFNMVTGEQENTYFL